jgi:UDP-N-acetylglucosamine 2-epimerase
VSVQYETEAIRDAIERCLFDENMRQRAHNSPNPYDYGGAGKSIVGELESVEINEELLRKQLTY